MSAIETQKNIPEEKLKAIRNSLADKTFRPHPLFRNGHAQTVAAYAWPKRAPQTEVESGEERLFTVAPGVQLRVQCHWQPERAEHPTVVLVHGLEGSSGSVYMISTTRIFRRAGFNVLRMNMRNCGGTEHLTPTLYHSGMSEDPRAVVEELIERDGLRRIFLLGFSMGGNLVLKLAGDYAEQAPPELIGIGAVSPALHLSACAEAISRRSNRLYERRFLSSLRRTMQHKQKLYPEIYEMSDFRRVRTIRDFDEFYTARYGGFSGASDYYERSSAIKVIPQIRRPTLIIHAQDDPFIPSESFRDQALSGNPYVILLFPRHGGHVGFISDNDAERFWAENRALDFCRHLLDEQEPISAEVSG
jgi:predicted alpha/beta-fold hydrolase